MGGDIYAHHLLTEINKGGGYYPLHLFTKFND